MDQHYPSLKVPRGYEFTMFVYHRIPCNHVVYIQKNPPIQLTSRMSTEVEKVNYSVMCVCHMNL